MKNNHSIGSYIAVSMAIFTLLYCSTMIVRWIQAGWYQSTETIILLVEIIKGGIM